jgi:hypothetical protein
MTTLRARANPPAANDINSMKIVQRTTTILKKKIGALPQCRPAWEFTIDLPHLQIYDSL